LPISVHSFPSISTPASVESQPVGISAEPVSPHAFQSYVLAPFPPSPFPAATPVQTPQPHPESEMSTFPPAKSYRCSVATKPNPHPEIDTLHRWSTTVSATSPAGPAGLVLNREIPFAKDSPVGEGDAGSQSSPTPEPFVDAVRAGEFLSLRPRRVLEFAREGAIPAYPLGHGVRRVWRP